MKMNGYLLVVPNARGNCSCMQTKKPLYDLHADTVSSGIGCTNKYPFVFIYLFVGASHDGKLRVINNYRARSANPEELAEFDNPIHPQSSWPVMHDPDYEPKPSTSQTRSEEMTLTVPRKALLSGSAELVARCKVSHRVTTAMTSQFVKICGVDLKDCSISTSTSYRHRSAQLKSAEIRIKENLRHEMPKHIVLHWDGKIIKYKHRRETDDRLAIVCSFPRSRNKHQFLTAPRIPDGTVTSQKDALVITFGVWEIPHNNIIGMSWDTTASTRGQHLGSVSLFEQEIGRSIIWLACRHHMGELHVKHADIETRGAWRGK